MWIKPIFALRSKMVRPQQVGNAKKIVVQPKAAPVLGWTPVANVQMGVFPAQEEPVNA